MCTPLLIAALFTIARIAEATQMSINRITDKEDVVCVCSSAKLCPTLGNPMDCILPGSSVHAIFQARILEWSPFTTPGDVPDLGIKPTSFASPALAGNFFF